MTRWPLVLIVMTGLLGCGFAASAKPAPRLVTDLSVDRIDISYSFAGADLLLFGAIEGMRGRMKNDIDIVTVVRGPTVPVVVRRKERVAGVWLNVESVAFQTAPGFYAVASTRPIEQITDEQTATIYELGLDELHLSPTSSADQSASDVKNFREGFLRVRSKDNLVAEQSNGVTVIGDILYRARVRIPANVPVGDFKAEVFLLHKGKVLARTKTEFAVQKSGFERSIYTFAHENSLAYGLAAILSALGAGWLAAWVFSQISHSSAQKGLAMFQKDLLKGQRILVTGGGTGLGKAMTEKYMELGAHCIIWGRRGGVLEETAEELRAKTGGSIETAAVDIRNPMAIDEAVARHFADGPLTGLVNNAAGNFISRTEDLSPNAFNAIASIVFHGTFNVTNAIGKRWIAGQLPGNVISIVTTWVWTGSPFTVPSAMSKAGIATMTQSLAVEWGPKGIRLNAIAPGPFPTKGAWERLSPKSAGTANATDGSETIPLRRMGKHMELANLAAFLMSDQTAYITGEVIAIDGGQWLASAGNFHELAAWGDAEWEGVRQMIQGANQKDKAERTAG